MNLHEIPPALTDAKKIEIALRVINRYNAEVRQLPDGRFQHRDQSAWITAWHPMEPTAAQFWIEAFDRRQLTASS